jgi:hypothetical protein
MQACFSDRIASCCVDDTRSLLLTVARYTNLQARLRSRSSHVHRWHHTQHTTAMISCTNAAIYTQPHITLSCTFIDCNPTTLQYLKYYSHLPVHTNLQAPSHATTLQLTHKTPLRLLNNDASDYTFKAQCTAVDCFLKRSTRGQAGMHCAPLHCIACMAA